MLEAYAEGLNAWMTRHPSYFGDRVGRIDGCTLDVGFVLTAPLFYGLDWLLTGLLDDKLLTPPERQDAERDSNGCAVASRRSADGATRLYSNSNQPWSGPAAWYEVRVESGEGWRFEGATLAGSPFPVVGSSPDHGWTARTIRVYRLKIDPHHPDRYRYGGAWRSFRKKRV